MALNLKEFINKQSKLIEKKSTVRVNRLDLCKKTIRGTVGLHIISDENEIPIITTKSVFEVHQAENYTYMDEEKTRYTTMLIPHPLNYSYVPGAIRPSDIQMKKLEKLIDLLNDYYRATNPWSDGGAKLNTEDTETKMWLKPMAVYTRFWAKVANIKPEATSNDKLPETNLPIICSHSSREFVNEFNNWASPDEDDEDPEAYDDKVIASLSRDITDQAQCIKIRTSFDKPKYNVDIKFASIEKVNVAITEDDLKTVTPLNQNDWDFTEFDDEKVDMLTARLRKYLDMIPEEEEYEDEEEESEEIEETDDEEESDNPFDDEDEEEEEEKPKKSSKKNVFDDDDDDE